MAESERGEWIVRGDFNAIVSQDEKLRGLPRPEWEMEEFRDYIETTICWNLGMLVIHSRGITRSMVGIRFVKD